MRFRKRTLTASNGASSIDIFVRVVIAIVLVVIAELQVHHTILVTDILHVELIIIILT